MAEPVLPGYTWDDRAGRYRNSRGQFVARRNILNLLSSQIDAGERNLAELTTAFHEGRISASTWTEQMRSQLKRLHLQNAALAGGGWDRTQTDPRVMGRVGGRLRADYQRLERFAQQVQAGDVTLPQALNRTQLYVGNSRKEFWDTERERIPQREGETLIERRMLGAAEHCPDCVDYHARGWQMLGSLPVPGAASVCLTNCKCRLEHRHVPSTEINDWIGTKR